MILMPDLFNYFLTGEKKAEYSIASTTQLLDAKKGEWSDEVIEALGIPELWNMVTAWNRACRTYYQ